MKHQGLTLTTEDDNGVETVHEIPTKMEVCDTCRGLGVSDPEGFSNGFSRDDFAEDPDFAEDYRAGKFDVSCRTCGGLRVVPCPDFDRMSAELTKLWWEDVRSNREIDEIYAAERAMGA